MRTIKSNILSLAMGIKCLLIANLSCGMLISYPIPAWAEEKATSATRIIISSNNEDLCNEVAKQFQSKEVQRKLVIDPNGEKEIYGGYRIEVFVPNRTFDYVPWQDGKKIEQYSSGYNIRKYIVDINNDDRKEVVISYRDSDNYKVYDDFFYALPIDKAPGLQDNGIDKKKFLAKEKPFFIVERVSKYIGLIDNTDDLNISGSTLSEVFRYKGRTYLLGITTELGITVVLDLGLPELQQEVCLFRVSNGYGLRYILDRNNFEEALNSVFKKER